MAGWNPVNCCEFSLASKPLIHTLCVPRSSALGGPSFQTQDCLWQESANSLAKARSKEATFGGVANRRSRAASAPTSPRSPNAGSSPTCRGSKPSSMARCATSASLRLRSRKVWSPNHRAGITRSPWRLRQRSPRATTALFDQPSRGGTSSASPWLCARLRLVDLVSPVEGAILRFFRRWIAVSDFSTPCLTG